MIYTTVTRVLADKPIAVLDDQDRIDVIGHIKVTASYGLRLTEDLTTVDARNLHGLTLTIDNGDGASALTLEPHEAAKLLSVLDDLRPVLTPELTDKD